MNLRWSLFFRYKSVILFAGLLKTTTSAVHLPALNVQPTAANGHPTTAFKVSDVYRYLFIPAVLFIISININSNI